MSLFKRRKPTQYDLYEPAGEARGVVALIHGGFWQSMYGREGLGVHCQELADDGFVAGNLVYRRVGDPGGGWPNTGSDVVAALQALSDAHGPLTAVVGHSAGGHLALWASKEITPKPELVVSVAGCNDMALAQSMNVGRGAIESLVGDDLRYLAEADPAQRLPLGTKAALIVAQVDPVVPNVLSESYLAKAQAAGDEVFMQTTPGDHFTILDVTSEIWAAVRAEIDAVA